MLSQIEEHQKDPPVIKLRLGGEYKYVFSHLYLINYICDGLVNEVLVGRRQYKGRGEARCAT